MSQVTVRAARAGDESAIVGIARELAEDGTEYVFRADATDEELRAYWLDARVARYVAVDGDAVVGCYLLRPNHAGRGAHVANAAYAVAREARGRGVGRAMGEHSLEEARRLGYRAMQFNLVVSTNTAAVALWEGLGFTRVGTLPGVFEHPTLGDVDAFVMFRRL